VNFGQRPTLAWAAWASGAACGLCALLSALSSCGGDGSDAPFTPQRERCPDVDDYLAPVLDLAASDRLPHLSAVISEDLSDAERDDAVALLFELVASLEPGSVSALETLPGGTDAIRSLERSLAASTHWLGEGGPRAPYLGLMGSFTVALNTSVCDGQPVFYLASELLADETLLLAALEAAQDPALDVQQLLDDLESREDDPRSGFRALLRDLLALALEPDFDVRQWTALLGFILDVEVPPWSSFVTGLEAFLVPGPRLTAVQSVLHCLSVADPDQTMSDVLYDLLTAPPEVVLLPGSPESGDLLLPDALMEPIMSLLATFQGDAEARRTLATLSTACVAPSRARGVLSDMALLFETGALVPLLDALVAAATRSCAP
jgi:hypothetical protein